MLGGGVLILPGWAAAAAVRLSHEVQLKACSRGLELNLELLSAGLPCFCRLGVYDTALDRELLSEAPQWGRWNLRCYS